MNKKSLIKFIDIAFWIIMFCTGIKSIFVSIPEGKNIVYMFNISPNIFINILFMFVMIAISTLGSIFQHIDLAFYYIIWKIAYKIHFKEKFDKADYKNEDYYREILDNYTVAEMSYIDDFKLSEKDVIATFMSLEYKGYIRINDSIEILKMEDYKLRENEKYMLSILIDRNVKHIDLEEYEEEVIKDCVNSDLLEKKSKVKEKYNKLKIKIPVAILLSLCTFLISSNVKNDFLKILLTLGVFFILVYVMILIRMIIVYPFLYLVDPYIRTKKAKKLNQQLEGLRKYLKDYSNMDERESKEIVLWKEYLIYSVFLGINTKIVDEYKEKLKFN